MPASSSIEEQRQIRWVDKSALPGLIRRKVMHAEVAMDVGCGIQLQTLVWPRMHICVEVHDEYVNYLRQRCSGSPRYLVMHSSWKEALRIMPSKSVDTVFGLDFIEHLPKAEGFDFLVQAERVARQQVILFTPLGYFPQSYENPDEKDRWGMHGGHWQTHRSGWTPGDFPAEWEIIACRDYHTHDQHGQLDEPAGCLWAIRTLSSPSAASEADDGWERRLWRQTMIYPHAPSWCRIALRAVRSMFRPDHCRDS